MFVLVIIVRYVRVVSLQLHGTPPPNRFVLYRLRLIRRRWGWRALARLPRLLVRRLDGTAACGRSPSRDEQVVAQPVDVDTDRRLALVGRHQAREGPMGQGQG